MSPDAPMGRWLRRFWIPAGFSEQVQDPDSPPVRVKLLGESLVMFRDTAGRVGLLDEACPHRTASLFFGRNEEGGLRCVYHGLKFDVEGRCLDVPCVPAGSNVRDEIRAPAYPCVERAGLIWTYMGASAEQPDFPELVWTLVPQSHRFVTRHVQQCNWLQAMEGGFDASHLAFLHSGAVDLRKGGTDHDRKVIPSKYEYVPTEAGFISAGGKDLGNGQMSWHAEVMLLPFHKIIPSIPRGAHVWVPMDDENTMLYSVNFDLEKPLDDTSMAREYAWRGIHTRNMPGTDYAVDSRSNDYNVNRALQATGESFTGIAGLGVQDCAMQESMGPIANRAKEYLLLGDAAIVRLRRLFARALDDHDAGRAAAAPGGSAYRVTATRFTAPVGASFAERVKQELASSTPIAAE